MSSALTQIEVEALRTRLSEYERVFAATAPRLAAFKQLEDLAKEQKTTPEAIAAKAALDVLKSESGETMTHIRELRSERDQLQADVSLVLIQKKTHDDRNNALRAEVEALSAERDTLRVERDELVVHRDALFTEFSELDSRQAEADRRTEQLQAQEQGLSERRSELEAQNQKLDVSAAESEVAASALRSDLTNLMGQKQTLETELEALETERAFRADELKSVDVSADAAGQASRSASRESTEGADSTDSEANNGFGFDEDASEGDEAFGRFFDADISHDKSREWILG